MLWFNSMLFINGIFHQWHFPQVPLSTMTLVINLMRHFSWRHVTATLITAMLLVLMPDCSQLAEVYEYIGYAECFQLQFPTHIWNKLPLEHQWYSLTISIQQALNHLKWLCYLLKPTESKSNENLMCSWQLGLVQFGCLLFTFLHQQQSSIHFVDLTVRQCKLRLCHRQSVTLSTDNKFCYNKILIIIVTFNLHINLHLLPRVQNIKNK